MNASILIANYNGEKFIEECLNSLMVQTNQNFEIIFFDDCSVDNSIRIAEKYKNIQIIKNTSRTKNGHFNQMNAYNEAYKISKGKIIFTLDSDDMFHPNKINNVMKYFRSGLDIVFDLPIILKNGKKIYKKNRSNFSGLNPFPSISPQSCLALKRELFPSIINHVFFQKFSDVWFDFRVGIFSKYRLNNIKIIDEHLTYYRITPDNISSKFTHLSKNWWKRRMDYHKYEKYYCNLNNFKYQRCCDYYLTKFINFFIIRNS